MNNSNIIFFAAGLGVGAGAAYFALKDRFNKLLDEEVSDLKEYYEDKYKTEENVTNVMTEVSEELDKEEPDYNGIIEKLNYNQFSTVVKGEEDHKIEEKPYIISTEEYNDDVNYDKMLLSYFCEDEILIDAQTDELIDNIGRIVGFDNLEQLSSTDDGEICIRNEVEGCDYRVILEVGSYETYLSGDV